MANVNKPFGLRPLGNLSATGAQKQYGYLIADNQSGAIYQGDLVTIDNGYLVKFNNTDHTSAVGVFNGCNYIDPTTGKPTGAQLPGPAAPAARPIAGCPRRPSRPSSGARVRGRP